MTGPETQEAYRWRLSADVRPSLRQAMLPVAEAPTIGAGRAAPPRPDDDTRRGARVRQW